MRPGVLTLVVAGLAAAPAGAAEPQAGSVSPDSPRVTWAGTLTAPYLSYGPMWAAGGAADQPCNRPSCDRFPLEVRGATADLFVFAHTSVPDPGEHAVRVIEPDGSTAFAYNTHIDGVGLVIENATPGTYLVDVTNGGKTGGTYDAVAELEAPPYAPAPVAPAGPTLPPVAREVGLSFKAPRIGRTRRFSVGFRVARTVTSVLGELRRGDRVVARAARGRTARRGRLTFRPSRRLRRGRYTLTLTASAADALSETRTVSFRVR